MNKKNNLALFALLAIGLISSLTLNLPAQKVDSVKSERSPKQCSSEKFVMPQSVVIGSEAIANFIKVTSLPSGKRQRAFSDLLNEEKASVFKVQLALQFVKRPDLTKEQKDLILDAISKISADTYNKEKHELIAKNTKQAEELQQKALAIFPPNEAYAIFASLSGEKDDINFLKKYESFISLATMGGRRNFFSESSPFEKSELWKAQMVNYLATTNFNKAQQEPVVEVISLSTPQAFSFPTIEGEDKNNETKALDALEAKANKLFSKEEVFAFFMSFGIHKIAPPINVDIINTNHGIEPERPNCDCNYFCWWGNCRGEDCRGTLDGCGWSGGAPCVFKCQ